MVLRNINKLWKNDKRLVFPYLKERERKRERESERDEERR